MYKYKLIENGIFPVQLKSTILFKSTNTLALIKIFKSIYYLYNNF